MPVKMMPSERRTAIQLRSPPTIAALTVPTMHAAAMGSEVWSAEDRRAVAADPGESADAEEELVRAPEDQVEADAVRGEHERLHGQRRGVRRVAEPERREDREDRRRDDDRQERPAAILSGRAGFRSSPSSLPPEQPAGPNEDRQGGGAEEDDGRDVLPDVVGAQACSRPRGARRRGTLRRRCRGRRRR